MASDSANLYTCLACQVAFHSAELQRTHYRSDWHRYNLKRKMAELPPVTADNFAQRVLAQQAKQTEEATKGGFSARCNLCQKAYSSQNAYNSHLSSKKHKDAQAKATAKSSDSVSEEVAGADQKVHDFPLGDNDQAMATDEPNNTARAQAVAQEREINRALDNAQTEEEVYELLEKKMQMARRLSLEECLFCDTHSATFEDNMAHMAQAHSLFIPDVEYVADLRGLITYLGEKITVANVCLYCNGRGRTMRSLDAVRNHMLDKGHCMIAYDNEDDILELSDYYDFSTTYPGDKMEGEPHATAAMNTEEPETRLTLAEARAEGIVFDADAAELVLPSGQRLGHRDLKRYYKQRFRVEDTRESVVINRLLTQYAEDGAFASAAHKQANDRALIMNQPRGRWALRQQHPSIMVKRRQLEYDAKVGAKANKLQKYFRHQILF
ncbi:pre-60S factor rei1 [Dimargaris verticillata]|uniref:Pre-60S factor rei1 n=1 Tax=Dimargaris verticillata TaxID=2761393 RepID=A0A9W8B535_9FUNG|nr:pre-60S factor rei1 [Dimargaris verticillata]